MAFSFKNLSFKNVFVWGFKFVIYSHLTLFFIVGLMCLYMTRYHPPITTLQLYRAKLIVSKIKQPTPIKIEDVSEGFLYDLIYAEDRNFYKHSGFDVEAIKRARKMNKKLGVSAFGGSTISQQLARTLFLVPTKNYLRKYLELLITLEMELILTKDRMLELYLSHVEWGDGIYGVRDASQQYYNTSFSEISVEQGIKLITILKSPIKWNPESFNKSPALKKRYMRIKRRYNYPNLNTTIK